MFAPCDGIHSCSLAASRSGWRELIPVAIVDLSRKLVAPKSLAASISSCAQLAELQFCGSALCETVVDKAATM